MKSNLEASRVYERYRRKRRNNYTLNFSKLRTAVLRVASLRVFGFAHIYLRTCAAAAFTSAVRHYCYCCVLWHVFDDCYSMELLLCYSHLCCYSCVGHCCFQYTDYYDYCHFYSQYRNIVGILLRVQQSVYCFYCFYEKYHEGILAATVTVDTTTVQLVLLRSLMLLPRRRECFHYASDYFLLGCKLDPHGTARTITQQRLSEAASYGQTHVFCIVFLQPFKGREGRLYTMPTPAAYIQSYVRFRFSEKVFFQGGRSAYSVKTYSNN